MNHSIQLPVQVVFRNLPRSEALEFKVREQAEKLGRYYDRIMGCRVMIELNHKHQHKGLLYHVRIDLTVPHAELVVNRKAIENHALENAHVAVRDAFEAMRRKLQTFTRKHQTLIKHHDRQYKDTELELGEIESDEFIEEIIQEELSFKHENLIDDDIDERNLDSEILYLETEKTEKPAVRPVYSA